MSVVTLNVCPIHGTEIGTPVYGRSVPFTPIKCGRVVGEAPGHHHDDLICAQPLSARRYRAMD